MQAQQFFFYLPTSLLPLQDARGRVSLKGFAGAAANAKRLLPGGGVGGATR